VAKKDGKLRGSRSSRPKAPLPESLPGEYFLMEYDRSRGRYILHLDNDDEESFDLGSDVQEMMRQFERWNLYSIGCEAIDRAREFGVAQAIPGETTRDDRVIALHNRSRKGRELKFRDGEEKRHGDLPRLTRASM
jgi:hypothetical protein